MQISKERKEEIKRRVFDWKNWDFVREYDPAVACTVNIKAIYRSEFNVKVTYTAESYSHYPVIASLDFVTVTKNVKGEDPAMLAVRAFCADVALYAVYLSEVEEYEKMMPEWYDPGRWKKHDREIYTFTPSDAKDKRSYEFVIMEFGKTKNLEDGRGLLIFIDAYDGVKIRKPVTAFNTVISFRSACDCIQKYEARARKEE